MSEKPVSTLGEVPTASSRSSVVASPPPKNAAPSHLQNVFVRRQPSYTQRLDVFAYELLFYGSVDEQASPVKTYQAMSQLFLNTLVDIGLETITGQKRAMISLTGGLILLDYGCMFPADRVMIKVAADMLVDGVLLEAVRKLSAQGYAIVLDDFRAHEHEALLEECIDVVTVDIAALDRIAVEKYEAILRRYDVARLAKKVASQDDFQFCKHLGFDYFQGDFLYQPALVAGRRSATNRITLLRLLAQLQDPDIEFDEVEALIKHDVTLSYKILRVINSAFYACPRTIDSIRDALLRLGLKSIRTWATLMLLAGIDDKPRDLLTIAMVRANMCERLAQAIDQERSETFFLVGLFSVLDALMDRPMAEILASLPLTDDVTQALLHHEGILGTVLRCVLDYEHGHWDEVTFPGLDRGELLNAYLEAIVWTDKMQDELASS